MPELPVSAQRVIDAAARKGVTLEIVNFDVSTHTAAEAARAVGAEVGQIVKSLVFVIERDSGLDPCIILVSGANMVDIALLSAVLTEPRIRRASAEEARLLTGFSIGGIPPFGHLKPLRTIMDSDLGRFEKIWAAAGTPNSVFGVTPATLRVLANATVASIGGGAAVRPEALPEPASDALPDTLPGSLPSAGRIQSGA